jgi:ribose transport system permease protein
MSPDRGGGIGMQVTGPSPPGPRLLLLTRASLARYPLQIFTVAALVTISVVLPDFRQFDNLQDVMLQSSFAGLSGVGMTLLIIGGMIDLSVAGIIALTAVTLTNLLPVVPFGVAVAAALAVGAALGLVNGVIVTKLSFPPFIGTYAMLNIYLAGAFIWTHASTLPLTDDRILGFASGEVFGVPPPFVLMIAGAIGCAFLLHRTRIGRNLRAIGSSEAASRMAGIAVDRTRIAAFVLFGVLTSAAGINLASLLSSASANMSIGYELNVVAVAVVGGTRLLGGSGTLLGTVTAAILFAALDNALNLLNISSYWQYVVAGVVLAVALVAASRGDVPGERSRKSGSR